MQLVLDCVTTILTDALCVLLFWRVYAFRDTQRLLRAAGIVCIIGVKLGLLFLQIPLVNFISSYLMFVGILLLVYACRVRAAILYATLVLMLMLASDSLGVLVVSVFYNHTISMTLGASDLTWQHHLWNWIFQVVLVRITALLIRRNTSLRVRWHEIMFYVLLLVFETVVFANASNAIQDYMNGRFLILMMSGFLLLDIYIMCIFHQISQARENEQNFRLIQQKERLQMQMYQELREKYDASCAVAHDINRHIRALQGLVAQHPDAQADAYLSDLVKETRRLQPQIRNQNAMLEIILNTVLERCEKEQIQLDLDVEDFPLTFLSDMDITTIFSNLLDNAVDACMELSAEQRKISVRLQKQAALATLRISNSCWNPDAAAPKYRHSTKKHHAGIGLCNVKRTVEKNGGVFSVEYGQKQFVVGITFITNPEKPQTQSTSVPCETVR